MHHSTVSESFIKRAIKRVALRAPAGLREALRRYHFARRTARGQMSSWEPEYAQLATLLPPGSNAIDVGANVGYYTLRMAELVGAKGQIYAFEPVASTFEILTTNCRIAGARNVTLFNAAASDCNSLVSMSVPVQEGSPNFYMAQISAAGGGEHRALAVKLDALNPPGPISLVKIDAEGHDFEVVRGMEALLLRDRPVLIVENGSPELRSWLVDRGYQGNAASAAGNVIYQPW